MNRVAVLNVVGLTKSLIGKHTPRLNAHLESHHLTSFKPAFPALTCSAQSTYLTGKPVADHGIVANGWYDRSEAEVKFWKQSNHIVQAEKIWDRLRRENPDFTCAKLFWWYNMYASADWTITPRPMYPADGRKFFDVYTQPMDLRETIKNDLGDFPFPAFWGPRAGIESSQWIADSAQWIERENQPTLSLVYLPHLDYCLQQYGPSGESIGAEVEKIDALVGDLIDFYTARNVEVVILSEYGISEVSKPIHLNRIFREQGWITIKDELGLEMIDCGASQVFAVADHQVAHVYVNDKSLLDSVRKLLKETNGVEEVRVMEADRAGDFTAVSEGDAWFTYYYWLDDDVAPDFARCVDIHRKIGYDPVELFIDPKIKFPMLKVAKFLVKKKLGFRGLLDVIPLDASLVKGSHGRDKVPEGEQPIYISKNETQINQAEDVFEKIIEAVSP